MPVDPRLAGKPVPRISRDAMERGHVARANGASISPSSRIASSSSARASVRTSSDGRVRSVCVELAIRV